MLKKNKASLGFNKVIAIVLACIVTVTLIFTMHLLIRMAKPELDKSKAFEMPKFVHVPEVEKLNTIEAPVKPPPVLDTPDTKIENVKPDIKLSDVGVSLKPSVSIVKDNKIGLAPGDGEYLPIVKIQPVYPRRAAERCVEGYVIVSFTVTANGSVENPIVIESSSKMFDRSAKSAAKQFKYKPRTVDGVGISVPNVTNKITYKLEGC